ncbi:hypothetical protein [Streptomyces sp. CB02488]|uniref:hypothetical protein n=1 Tax=Streptomyces sp. CB02488 TaxID=1703920 RepID=UPI001160E6B2|nr:hypothetical protein [Streptomyces sp. CB02488]
MRFHAALSTAAASVLVLFAGTGTSHAASDSREAIPSITADATTKASAVVVGCLFESMKPFYVTAGGPLYAQGKIKSCTTPKPDACKLDVTLEKKLSNGLYGVVANKNTGWKTCKAKTLSVPYKCPQRIQKHTYKTVSSLQIEYKGKYGTKVVGSSTIATNC